MALFCLVRFSLKYDYHCHSTYSDGKLTPLELVERAKSFGVQSLALTDHDTFMGWPEFSAACLSNDIQPRAGIEFSCVWSKMTIHILAFDFEFQSDEFEQLMGKFNHIRQKRAERIDYKLQQLGLPSVLNEALTLAGHGQIGRPHFAQVLVRDGHCKDMNQAFKRYLGAGKAGDVKAHWPEVDELLQWLSKIGAKTLIAHPHRYNMTRTKLSRLIEDFFAAGGDGIEVASPGMHPDMRKWLLELTSSQHKLVSGGSDFHFAGPWSELGKFPPLPLDRLPLTLGN